MHSRSRRALYAQVFGLFCVAAGTLALFLVGVGVVVGIRNGEGVEIPLALAPYLVLGVGLVVLGRLVSARYGGASTTGWLDLPTGNDPEGDGPDLNALEELGYVTPEPSDDDESVESDGTTDPTRVSCPECGVENDVAYDFCENCASSLG